MCTQWRLAAIFADVQPQTVACEDAAAAPGTAELDAALERALERGRAAYPSLTLSDEAFVRFLGDRVAPSQLPQSFVEDLFLACACALGDAAAIAELQARHFSELAGALRRGGVDAAICDETLQGLRARMLVADGDKPPGIAAYAGRGPLGGWLRVAAFRAAYKERRGEERRRRATRSAVAEGLPEKDPELVAIRARYGAVSGEAFRDAFGLLAPAERLVLKLTFGDGLNLDRLAVVLGVSRATAGRRVVAARERLLDEALRLLGERLQASATEVRSLLGALRSELEISFGALVRSVPTAAKGA